MPSRLVTMPFSHFCEKARWALDATGVAYDEEGHVPGFHRLAVRRAGGRSSVPVLVTEAGHVLTQSADIVRFADAEAPAERKIVPEEPRARARAQALEKHLDEDFAPHVRRFAYFHLLPRRSATFRLFDLRTPAAERIGVRVVFPLLRRAMKRMMRIDEPHAMASRDKTRAVFDEVEGLLRDGRPFLTGDRLSSADIAFAAFSAPVVLPAEHPVMGAGAGVSVEALPEALAAEIRLLQTSPGGRFAARLYRECRQMYASRH